MQHHNIITLMGYAVFEDQLSDEQALPTAIKVAVAVHYMHSQDPIVIHQDLKSQNVLVSNTIVANSHKSWPN